MKTELVNRFRRMHACWLVPALVATAGCASEGETNLERDGNDNITDTYLSFEEFEAKTYREPDTGVYIVNGDVAIENVDKLREFWEQLKQPGALAVSNISGTDQIWNTTQRYNISYCVNSSSFGVRYGTVVDAMRRAAADWAQIANVQFVHAAEFDASCTNTNNNVVFDVQQVSGQPYAARAFSPAYARASRQLRIDATSFDLPGAGKITFTGILRHELGHVLGFRHEHTRPEAGKCFEDNNWRGVTAYDANSVMHYPQCNGTNTGDLLLTTADKFGVAAVYGRRNGGLENLAYLKSASASSTGASGYPSRAVDGDPDGFYHHSTTAQTDNELAPFWQVDLGAVKPVGDVILSNRTDIYSDWLNNFQVTLSTDGTNFQGLPFPGHVSTRQAFTFNQSARYVRVALNPTAPRAFSLSEVEVLRARILTRDQTFSLMQSTTALGAGPLRALDGNTNGNFNSASVTHTTNELSPWWEVSFTATYPIGEIIIYNRTDCCGNRLTNFKVMTGMYPNAWSEQLFPGSAGARERFVINKFASDVRIQLVNNGTPRPLSLAEVEIIAARNLSLGKTATQSSDQSGAIASRAIDGNANGKFSANSTTLTTNELSPWWQVDLGRSSTVSEVVLYNRTDCCSTGLSNFKVSVSPNGVHWVPYNFPGFAGLRHVVPINGEVRYVKVQLNDTGTPRPLSLAEVEVIPAQRYNNIPVAVVHRAYNSAGMYHLYTSDLAEATQVGLEVQAYFVIAAAQVDTLYQPLHRCAKPGQTHLHLYTTDPGCEGWIFEGILGYVSSSATPGSKPLYRLFNPATQNHFYTISTAERDGTLSGGGWSDEGITGYVF